ncbi:MAG: 5-deoxy-glucuronate isomerase [Coxiellaceae bacterium]|nr:5-deoxy-glucuronate isomerase [Coxiellaceae bacterium]
MSTPNLLIRGDSDYPIGYSAITTIGEDDNDTGINFGILKLKAGEQWHPDETLESAYLLMHGEVCFQYQSHYRTVKRDSLFDQAPTALHLPANCPATITAISDVELSVQSVVNETWFEPTVFDEHNLLENEHRGQGLLNDTAYRIVRTIFDVRNRPDAKLVLGEVITFPGRWSSYPPHHHAQPEIYHYRFTEPQGYGHGECGDDVVKIRQNDTLKILYDNDHGQCAAPGYGMYYIWVIRHLDGDPYTVPEFTEQHAWTKQQAANQRVWGGTAAIPEIA